jgi:hypothetical protein
LYQLNFDVNAIFIFMAPTTAAPTYEAQGGIKREQLYTAFGRDSIPQLVRFIFLFPAMSFTIAEAKQVVDTVTIT